MPRVSYEVEREVEKQIDQGKSPGEIETAMREAGFSKEEIRQCLAPYQKEGKKVEEVKKPKKVSEVFTYVFVAGVAILIAVIAAMLLSHGTDPLSGPIGQRTGVAITWEELEEVYSEQRLSDVSFMFEINVSIDLKSQKSVLLPSSAASVIVGKAYVGDNRTRLEYVVTEGYEDIDENTLPDVMVSNENGTYLRAAGAPRFQYMGKDKPLNLKPEITGMEISEPRYYGKDWALGYDCKVYGFEGKGNAGSFLVEMEMTLKVKVWLRESDNAPIRIESSGEMELGKAVATIEFWDYGEGGINGSMFMVPEEAIDYGQPSDSFLF